jgi:YHS domain-containing protein
MKPKAIAGLMIAASLSLAPDSPAAGKGHAQKHKKHGVTTEKKASQAQTSCPVMGGKINPKLYVDANGKRIYVCCKGCIAAVKKAPAKYIRQLEDQGVTVAKLQTTCPVMGGKINPKLYVDADGKRIYVCCRGCIAAIRKDPAKYISKLEGDGVVLEDVPATAEHRPEDQKEGHH